MTALAGPPAGIAFNATHPTVPPPIAATNPPQPAGFGQPAPDRQPSSPLLAGNDRLNRSDELSSRKSRRPDPKIRSGR